MSTQTFQTKSRQIGSPVDTTNSIVNMGNTGRLVSAAAGAAIAAVALTTRRGGNWRYAMLALGGGLIARGATGFCPVQEAMGIDTSADAAEGLSVSTSVVVRRPIEDVYNFWRTLENLPQFMTHLEDVREISDTRSHWTAKIPADMGKLYWEAEIVEEIPNQLIVWQSLENADIENAGHVHFAELPDGEGTEVHVRISYNPPAGALGDAVGALLNGLSERIIKKNIKDFKALMEEGLEKEESSLNFKTIFEKAASII